MALFSLETASERNTVIVSAAFFLVFVGWSASSSFATTKNGNVGATSIGIVYLVFTFSNLIALPIIANFSPRLVMFMSALTYGLYIASNTILDPLNNEFDKFVLYLLSTILGFGAATIWISQSLFITKCANIYEQQNNLEKNSKLGYFNGIFFMFFLFNRFCGFLLSGILFYLKYEVSTVFTILSNICLCGCFAFWLLKPEKAENKQQQTKDHEIVNISTISQIKLSIYNTVKLWRSYQLLCLIGFTMFTGVDLQFNGGVFPLLINEKSTKFFILSIFGLTASISSLILGKLSDKTFTRLQILIIGFVCKLTYYSYLYLQKEKVLNLYQDKESNDGIEHGDLVILITCALLMGIGDGCLLTQLSAIYPILLGKEPEVFANIKLWQSLSAAIVFFMHSSLTLVYKIKINLALLIIGYLPFVFCDSIRAKLI